MAKTIDQILHHKNIMGVIEAIKGGVPSDIVPAIMMQPTKRIEGNKGTYTKVTSTRKVARSVMYGSPSILRSLSGIAEIAVNLIHSFEHFNHVPNLMPLLLSLDGGKQSLGAEIVGRKAAEFAQLFINLRTAAWFSALAKGFIYFDASGNMLVNETGAVNQIDFGIPAGNRNQLNVAGNGTIITASWATAGTDISIQLNALDKQSAAFTGYAPKYAFYGANVPGYLARNTTMKEFLKFHPASNQAVRNGQVPNGFQEKTWIKASHAFYQDDNGGTQFFWGDNTVVFTPDPSDAGWWGLIEGSYAIPTNVGQLPADANAALRALQTIFGLFGYAKVIDDPVTIRQYGGDTVLPFIAVPNAVFIAEVAGF